MSESVELIESGDQEVREQASSTVEAQYELFNRELGLDENKDKETTESCATGDEQSSTKNTANDEDKEEEADEPDSDDEIPEEDAVDEWDGEDPSEAEIAHLTLPAEHVVLNELNEQQKKRRVVIYPVKLGELGHPSVIEVIKNCYDFKTTFVQSKLGSSDENEKFSYNGVVEFNCKSSVAAVQAIEILKSIREDITVKVMEPLDTTKKLMQHWMMESAASTSAVQNLIVAKPLSNDVTVEQIREFFPDAADIVIAKPKSFSRLAYVCYDEEDLVDEAVNKYKTELPVVGDRRVKVFKYNPPKLPPGFLKLERRYRILLQIKKLEKALNSKKANYFENQRKKMKSTIEHCTSLIEKDDASRNELGLKVFTLQELHRVRKIREAVKPGMIWLPRKPGDKREDSERVDLGDDDGRDTGSKDRRSSSKRSDKKRPNRDRRSNWSPPHHERWNRGSSSGVPSLLSIAMDDPVARVKAVTSQIAALTSMLPFGFGGMRGGMMRGREPPGRFGPGRGGFMGDDMGPDFGPPGGPYGPRRGGRHGGFNKRSRQDSSSDRSGRDAGRDEPVVEELSGPVESFQEPSGKVAKVEPAQGWSSDSKEDNKQPVQPAGAQSGSFQANKGKLGGWSKPVSKFSPAGNISSSGPVKEPSFNQGGAKRGGVHSGGFNQGGFNQGGGGGFNSGGGGNYGPGGGGYNQGPGAANYSHGQSGGYNQGPSGFNQGPGTGYNQGAGGGYDQGAGGGYGQGAGYGQHGGFNQGNMGDGSTGYNQGATGSYNPGGGGYNPNAAAYDQSYQQSSGAYSSHNTGYDYGYGSQGASGGSYQGTAAPVPPVAGQQSWNAPGQNYWQQPSQGNWQQAANSTGPAGQSSDQGAYSYGWNSWK